MGVHRSRTLEPCSTLLRNVAIVLSVIVATGFALFALEDIDRGSANSVQRIAGDAGDEPEPAGERERERRHGQPREAIDDVNDVLLKPFAGLSDSAESRWLQRGVPACWGCSSTAWARLPRAVHEGSGARLAQPARG